GCKVLRVADHRDRLDLQQVLKVLAENGITRLMVEGGPRVGASFVEADLGDEVVLLRGENTCGSDGIDPVEGMRLDTLTGRLKFLSRDKLATDTVEYFARAS